MSEREVTESPAADAEESQPEDPHPFAELGLGRRLVKALRDLGYEQPTPIQAETIPALLEGRHVVGLAQTGTGKTAAFALPILSQLDLKQKAPQALVLAPTRELALQVCDAFEEYASHMKGVRLLPIYGGQGYGVQLAGLARGVHIVVGTPGRIIDHLGKGTLDLTQLRFLVLDEADEMLSMGFAEDVEQILVDTPTDKHVALFSATMPDAIRELSAQYLTDPIEVAVKGSTATAPNVTHRYLVVSYQRKVDALTRILEVEDFDGMIVFVRTKNETETVAEKLRARGFSVAALNGDIPQPVRERTIEQLKAAKLDILVATDVAARGLDVDRISHVVNFDIPTDVESYIHRVGRTGRAGRSGQAISFVTPRERRLLRSIERTTGQQLTLMNLPTAEDINASRLSRFDDAITQAIQDADRIGFFRDVVSHYVNEYDVPELDVAAALASVLQGDEPMLLDPDADPVVRHREPAGERATYRIAVGRRHRVTPRQVVGALANEGGLRGADLGRIDIHANYTLVDLPARLPQESWEALRNTRISGKLIALERDTGFRKAGKPRKGRRER